jgi:hypothetical protein
VRPGLLLKIHTRDGVLGVVELSTAVQAHAVGSCDVALERHYTVGEIAKLWHADYKTVRKMFEGEPGVLTWGDEETRYKRGYCSMRIPESVMIRVHRKYRTRN